MLQLCKSDNFLNIHCPTLRTKISFNRSSVCHSVLKSLTSSWQLSFFNNKNIFLCAVIDLPHPPKSKFCHPQILYYV